MTTYAMQVAVLDAAAESLAGVADLVAVSGADLTGAVALLAAAAPGSALRAELPGLPLDRLTEVLAGQCRQTAGRVADGAAMYRQLDSGLVGSYGRAGAVAVPR